MDKRDDGGPAFGQITVDGESFSVHSGMSLRDWFAGQALQGMIAHPSANPHWHRDHHKVLANLSYEMANAMIEARK